MRIVKSKEIIAGLVVLALFVFAAYLSQVYAESLKDMLVGGSVYVGMVVFIILTVLATVFAPASTLPLIPVASVLWGPVATALLSIISWTIGSMIAFGLAKRYGKPLVRRFVNLDKLDSLESQLSGRNMFMTVIILRLTIPVDILSYGLGLFAPIGWRMHALATIIGVTPFAFVFAYAGSLSIKFQIITLSVAAVVMLGMLLYIKRNVKSA